MWTLAEISRTGLTALLRYPARSCATLVCLLTVLVPFLAGISISNAIQAQAEMSVQSGADLYVGGEQFGRPSAIAVGAAESVKKIDGVERVTPRIVGGVTLGKNREHAVVVGMPSRDVPETVDCIEGRMFLPDRKWELVVGSELARRLQLKPGDRIPPFYQSRSGDHVCHVVGVFRSDVSLWQAQLVFTSLETAAEIFDQAGSATELLVDCREGYAASVARRIRNELELAPGIRPRIVSRAQLAAVIPQGLLHREGIFNLHFMLACLVGALVILVTSGFGLSDRRREIGILKAMGWQTDEVLLRSLVESFLLSVLGTALSVVLAFIWLRAFNGFWIAGIFLAGVDAYPGFRVPFRMTPMPTIVALVFSFAMVMSGTLYSTWRAAIVAPREAMR